MQIFRNLKPYWKSVITIALLLVLQAYCDLSLPDYTSKLIDTGIQNYGIENCSPKQIPEKAYKVIDGFMDDDEKAVWEKYYKDGSDGYYYLTEDGEEHIDEVDSACMKGLMMYYYPYQTVNSDEDNEIKAGLDKMGITLDEMPEEMWAQICLLYTSCPDHDGQDPIGSRKACKETRQICDRHRRMSWGWRGELRQRRSVQ